MSRVLPLVEDLVRLLPETLLSEEVRRRLMEASVPDPERVWDRSASYVTVDKRVVPTDRIEGALSLAYDGALAHLQRTMELYRSLFDRFLRGDHAGAAHDLVHLGEEAGARGAGREARLYFDAALRLSMPLADKRVQTLALRRIARTLRDQAELVEATEVYERSLELARDSGDREGEIVALIGIATVLMYQGRWADAQMHLESALAALDSEDAEAFRLERAQLANNKGLVLLRQERFEEAGDWLARGMAAWGSIDSPADLAVCQHSRASMLLRQGRRAEARAILEEALELPIPAALSAVIATDLAQAYAEDSLVRDAEEWGRRAEEFALRSGSPYYLGHMYRGLGNIAEAQGHADGLTFFEKALEIARTKDMLLLEGEVLVDYARLRARIGGVEEAQAYLERAESLFTQIGAVGELARLGEVREQLFGPPGVPLPA